MFQRHGLLVLAAVAAFPFLLPFALGACTKKSDGSPATSSSSSPSSSPSSSASASSSSSSAAIDTPTTLPNGPIALPMGTTSSSAGHLSQKEMCDIAVRRFAEAVARRRTCSVDADCSILMAPCGLPGACGVSVSTSAKDSLARMTVAYNALHCAQVEALPCATCAQPPAPKCVKGTCE